MKTSLLLFLSMLFAGCQEPPEGKWEAIERVEVYRNDDSFKVLFYILPGEVCSLSPEWDAKKAAGYKRVICEKGEGWIMDDTPFKRVD